MTTQKTDVKIRLGSQTTILTDLPNGQVEGRYATDAERKLLASAPALVEALKQAADDLTEARRLLALCHEWLPHYGRSDQSAGRVEAVRLQICGVLKSPDDENARAALRSAGIDG